MTIKKWHSVKEEGLPEKAGFYHAKTKSNPVKIVVIEVNRWRDNSYWHHWPNTNDRTHITHWKVFDGDTSIKSYEVLGTIRIKAD